MLPNTHCLQVMAEVMGAEAAAVRIQFVSGTHAISAALYGCLRPGDELLAVAGRCGLEGQRAGIEKRRPVSNVLPRLV